MLRKYDLDKILFMFDKPLICAVLINRPTINELFSLLLHVIAEMLPYTNYLHGLCIFYKLVNNFILQT